MRVNITIPVDTDTKESLETLAKNKKQLLAAYVRRVLEHHVATHMTPQEAKEYDDE
jgi:predicted DNA-binding protein